MDMNLCRLLMLVGACVVTFSCLLGPVHRQQDGGHGFNYTCEYPLSLRGSSAVDMIHNDFLPELSHSATEQNTTDSKQHMKRKTGEKGGIRQILK